MGFSRQEYWRGLLCPSPGDLPDPGIEPVSLTSHALAGRSFTTTATWEALRIHTKHKTKQTEVFSGRLVHRTQCFHCCGPGFNPRSGQWDPASCELAAKIKILNKNKKAERSKSSIKIKHLDGRVMCLIRHMCIIKTQSPDSHSIALVFDIPINQGMSMP